jgi:hypothetical protein
MTKTKRPKNLDLKHICEKLWSILVKARAGYRCEFTGKETALNSHHIFKKASLEAYFDLDNGLCVCESVHEGFHQKGQETYEMQMERTAIVLQARGIAIEDVRERLEESKHHIVDRPMFEYFEKLYGTYQDYLEQGLIKVELTIPTNILEYYVYDCKT